MSSFWIIRYLEKYGAAMFSGVLLVLCFPKANLWPLAWTALIPFLVSLYGKNGKQAFHSGLALGIPYFFGTLYWIYHSINHFGGIGLLSSILLVILLSLYLSLYTGIFAFLFSASVRRSKLPAVVLAPVLWVVLEFLRSYVFTGFPWASIGYSQSGFLILIQIADLTGVYGVSFLVVAVNGALADIFLLKKRIRDMPLFPVSFTVAASILLAILLVGTFAYGYVRLGQPSQGKPFTAAIIQGNIAQDKKWEPSYQKSVLETYKHLSFEAAAASPSLIIWPETAVPFLFGSEPEYTHELTDFAGQLNSELLFGSILVKEKKNDNYLLSNSAVLLSRTGAVTYVYDKIHLVPFGEYVPLRKVLFFIDKLVVGIGDYAPGEKYMRASTPYGDFSTVICYEIVFPGLVRKFFADGGDFMVNITNDAWFGSTAGPYQHLGMAVFRAVENRKPLIRAANTGFSAYIDSNGKIVSRTGLFETTVLQGTVTADSRRSFYTKYGDLFAYFCIIFCVIFMTDIIGRKRTI